MIEYLILAQLKAAQQMHFQVQTTPLVSAESALVYDLNTDNFIYKKNIHQKLSIASLTKLITAYIIISEHDLQEIVTVPSLASTVAGSSMGLRSQDQLTIHQLLQGLLINSGNDAALTLALHNGGDLQTFVSKMNLYAKMLGLQHSSFQNPMGFDHPKNFSTAADLLKLSRKITQFPIITQIANTKQKQIKSLKGRIYKLRNTNQELHNYLAIQGLKTGKTDAAQECFIGLNKEQKLSIVLNSQNRFLDTKNLLDWSQKINY